jgi:HPt (histidine-containing phosphotransfer) domain-containing protein
MLVNLKQSSHRVFESPEINSVGQGRAYFNIKGLDVDGALKRLANRWDFYDRLVSRFYAEHLDFFERLHQQQSLGNYEVVHRMLHSLKGISGTIGASELYPLSVEAEHAYKNCDPLAESLVAKAEASLAQLLGQIVTCKCFSIPQE